MNRYETSKEFDKTLVEKVREDYKDEIGFLEKDYPMDDFIRKDIPWGTKMMLLIMRRFKNHLKEKRKEETIELFSKYGRYMNSHEAHDGNPQDFSDWIQNEI